MIRKTVFVIFLSLVVLIISACTTSTEIPQNVHDYAQLLVSNWLDEYFVHENKNSCAGIFLIPDKDCDIFSEISQKDFFEIIDVNIKDYGGYPEVHPYTWDEMYSFVHKNYTFIADVILKNGYEKEVIFEGVKIPVTSKPLFVSYEYSPPRLVYQPNNPTNLARDVVKSFLSNIDAIKISEDQTKFEKGKTYWCNEIRNFTTIRANLRTNELEKDTQKKLYDAAVASRSVSKLADYIYKNYYERYFNRSSYGELAKLLAKDNNIQLKELPEISNPYSLDKSCIYFAQGISVYQWTGKGTFLANSSERELLYIRSVYDLSTIEKYGNSVFLRYAGVFEYNSISAGVQVVPQFDLIYTIKIIPNDK